MQDVGESFRRADIPDRDREVWIRIFARRMERSMQRYEASGCFGHRGEADAHRLRMEALIRCRSKGQVLALEIKRGLV